MRRAAVHVRPDPNGSLSLSDLQRVIEHLRASGIPVIASDLARVAPGRREIEILLDGETEAALRQRAVGLCSEAVGAAAQRTPPEAVALTYTSSGGDADALGIMRAFGVAGEVRLAIIDDDDRAILIVEEAGLRDLPTSRLQTALQSGLNREVELVTSWDGPSRPL